MTSNNYTSTICVSSSPEQAYLALTQDIEKWWTKPDAPMKKVGDRAKFAFPPNKSYWTFEATALDFEKRVEMVCVDAFHLHEGQPLASEAEWLDTRVVWTIEENGFRTDIKLEHHGLVPRLHCYAICTEGWNFFFTDSLKAYLDTGVGKPHSAQDLQRQS